MRKKRAKIRWIKTECNYKKCFFYNLADYEDCYGSNNRGVTCGGLQDTEHYFDGDILECSIAGNYVVIKVNKNRKIVIDADYFQAGEGAMYRNAYIDYLIIDDNVLWENGEKLNEKIRSEKDEKKHS